MRVNSGWVSHRRGFVCSFPAYSPVHASRERKKRNTSSLVFPVKWPYKALNLFAFGNTWAGAALGWGVLWLCIIIIIIRAQSFWLIDPSIVRRHFFFIFIIEVTKPQTFLSFWLMAASSPSTVYSTSSTFYSSFNYWLQLCNSGIIQREPTF